MEERDMMDVAKERIEKSLWDEKATMYRIGQDPLEGRLNRETRVFTSKSGFEYFCDVEVRWSGSHYVVWGSDGIIGQVKLEESK